MTTKEEVFDKPPGHMGHVFSKISKSLRISKMKKLQIIKGKFMSLEGLR